MMEIFGGLKPGQAVGWVDRETAETRYAIKIPDWVRHCDLKTGDGEPVNTGAGGQVVLPGRYDFMPPDLIAVRTIPGEVVGSWDRDGNYHTKEERERVRSEYVSWLDDDGDFVCNDIDKEYELKKQYQQIFKDAVVDREPDSTEEQYLDIEVVGWWEPTGSDFIKTPYQQASVYWKRGGDPRTGIYKLMTSDLARDEIRAWVEENPGEKVDTIDRPRFLKVNGKFVFTNAGLAMLEETGRSELFTTLQEAQVRETEVRKMIRSYLDLATDNQPLEAPTAFEIMQFLEQIEKRVKGIDPKQKSQADKRHAVKRIQDTADRLRKVYSDDK